MMSYYVISCLIDKFQNATSSTQPSTIFYVEQEHWTAQNGFLILSLSALFSFFLFFTFLVTASS